MSLRVCVFGSKGRMGQELLSLIDSDASVELVTTVDRVKNPNVSESKDSLADLDPKSFDVLIDFSLPPAFQPLVKWCSENNVKLVSGTTGISDRDRDFLKEAAAQIACLWAPNMSLGVNLVAQLIPQLKALSGFDFQIVEAHHNKKKDAPSGTALFLQEELLNVSSQTPKPLALRGGGIFGIHEIWAMGEEETIKIEHTALNRAVFARGALEAAKWIASQSAGLYTIKDVLSARLSK